MSFPLPLWVFLAILPLFFSSCFWIGPVSLLTPTAKIGSVLRSPFLVILSFAIWILGEKSITDYFVSFWEGEPEDSDIFSVVLSGQRSDLAFAKRIALAARSSGDRFLTFPLPSRPNFCAWMFIHVPI